MSPSASIGSNSPGSDVLPVSGLRSPFIIAVLAIRRGMSFLRRQPEPRLAASIIVVALVYSLAMIRYRVLNFMTFYPLDTAVAVQALWNILNGVPYEETLSGIGSNQLAYHGYFSLAVLAPILQIFPSALVVCMAKNACVVLSAIPMYWIIRRLISSKRIRLLVLGMYCAAPFMIGFGHGETHLQLFALPAVVASYHFYRECRFRAFIWCMVICLLTKEHFSILYAGWAVLALLQRRPLRWFGWTLFLAVGYFGLYHQLKAHVFIPASATDLNLFRNYYGFWGDSLTSCLMNMLGHPAHIFTFLCDPNAWLHLAWVAFPFLPFLFLRPHLLFLSAPMLAAVFLMSGRSTEIFHFGLTSYYAEASVFAFISFIECLAAWQTGCRLARMQKWTVLLLLGFWVACFFLKDRFTTAVLVCDGLKNSYYAFISLGCLSMLGILWTHQASPASWRRVGRAVAGMLVVVIIFYFSVSPSSNLFAEFCGFQFPKDVLIRNVIARAALQTVPGDRWLSVPAKYAILVSTRSRAMIYNGTEPLASHPRYSPGTPGYVFLDIRNYNTIFDISHLAQTWDRSHIQQMINDSAHWDIVFYFDGLYLLRRREAPSSQAPTKKVVPRQ